jgi:hypothetical protein
MPARPRKKALFPIFLGAVMLLFIGILFYVYSTTSRTTIIMLDESGKVRQTR